MRRFTSALLLCVVAFLAFGRPADAHSGKQSYVYLSIFDDEMTGRVELPARDIEPVLGFEVPQDGAGARAALDAHYDEIVDYVADHISIGADGEVWPLEFDDYDLLFTSNGTYVWVPFEVDRTFDAVPERFDVSYDGIIESNPEKDALLLIEHHWPSATFNNEADELLGFSVGLTEQTVVPGSTSTLTSMAEVRGLGTTAVRAGIDVMLLTVAVLLPAAFVSAGATWRAGAPTARAALERTLWLLGSLVLGHSVVLWAVGLGLFDLPDRFASTLVAATLLIAAIWSMAGAVRPAITRAERPVVAAIGLVQGVALGETFVEEGLDRSRPFLSLVAFHLGVEVAVVVVATLLVPILFVIGRTRAAIVVFVGLGAALCAYAFGWLGERAGDADLSMEEVANPLRVWPRNGVILVLVFAAAVGLWATSRSRGWLRPVAVGRGAGGETDGHTGGRPGGAADGGADAAETHPPRSPAAPR